MCDITNRNSKMGGYNILALCPTKATCTRGAPPKHYKLLGYAIEVECVQIAAMRYVKFGKQGMQFTTCEGLAMGRWVSCPRSLKHAVGCDEIALAIGDKVKPC